MSELTAGGTFFFAKYRDPSGGSQLSGGGIIILRVIRRHFPVWAPTVSLFRCCCLLTMLTSPRREHKRGGRGRGLGREPPGAGEATVADAHAEGRTSADWSAAG